MRTLLSVNLFVALALSGCSQDLSDQGLAFPRKSKTEREFRRIEPDIDELLSHFQGDENVEQIVCFPGGPLIVHAASVAGEDTSEYESKYYASLCKEAPVHLTRVDYGFRLNVGSEWHESTEYRIAIVRLAPTEDDGVDCDDVLVREPFGSCSFDLGKGWWLAYEWIPLSFYEEIAD